MKKGTDIYEESAKKFGAVNTGLKFIEEMSECIQAVSKLMEGGSDFDNMAEEMVDVMITMYKWMYVMKEQKVGFMKMYLAWYSTKLRHLEEITYEDENHSH